MVISCRMQHAHWFGAEKSLTGRARVVGDEGRHEHG